MRKVISILLSLILAMVIQMPVFANEKIAVILDGNKVYFDGDLYIEDDRVMVPVRNVLEKLDVDVRWDEASKMIYAAKGETSMWIQVGNTSSTYITDGSVHVYKLGVSPRITDNRMYVPVRAVADVFGIDISWSAADKIVYINTQPQPEAPVYNSYADTEVPGNIVIDGFASPDTLNIGKAFTLKGNVTSAVMLDRLNVKIRDKATGNIEINETQFEINNNVYSLSDIDSRVRFGILSRGDKLMEITAVDKNEYRQTFSYDFTIRQPEGVNLGSDMGMLWPVPSSGLITTIFWCDNPLCHSNAGRVNGHAAIDVAANENADVIAVADGVVKLCGYGNGSNGHSGYGNFIELDHGNGIITQYAHLCSIYVTEGQTVSAGQVIGGVGNTGNSSGNHLDFHIEKNGKRCDPLYYLDIPSFVRCKEPCDLKYFNEALTSRGIVR